MTVREILERKGSGVVCVSPEDLVLEAARRMTEARVGAVVVVDASGGVVGMFTERDILQRVVGQCRRPDGTLVAEVMSAPITCCKPSTPLSECQAVMTNKRLRHLPVMENDRLVGIISSGDILAEKVGQQQSAIEYLHEYMYGRA